MNYRCRDCDHTTTNPSSTGPIKDVDIEGQPTMDWIWLCPNCFGENIHPYEPDEVDIGIGTITLLPPDEEIAIDALFKKE